MPISQTKELDPIVNLVHEALNKSQLSHRIDDTGIAIGKRYARTDELGIPFAITVDFESTQEPHTVTLRDLPSMLQVRLEVRFNFNAIVNGM